MKKYLIATFVFAVAFVASTAMAYDFGTTTLKVGSKGEAVKTLQTLVGASPVDGVFGKMTKAKVQAWQAANGLTADGLFGNASKAKANGAVSGNFPAGCTSAAGFSSTTGQACVAIPSTVAGCASGALFSSTTGQACAGTTPVVSTSGEGSVAVSYEGTPSDSLAVNKGEAKAVMGIKIKATGSDMKVTRLWLDIDKRIWLYADSISLLDGSTVLATIPLSASSVTEVTAGSSYQIQFNGLNFVVPVGTTKVLTVKISRPTLTNSSGNVALAATSSIRTVDGAGISDTYTLGARTWNLAAVAAATGTLTASLDAGSPLTQSIAGLSATSGVTTAVKLMDIKLKATDGPVNITALSGTLTAAGTCTAAQCVATTELRDGSTILDSVTGAGTFAFADLNVDIATDTSKVLSVWGLINPISATLVKGDAITAAVTSITATTGTTYTAITDSFSVTGNKLYFYQYAPTLTLGATSASSVEGSAVGKKQGNFSIAFTVTAPTGSDIYVDTATTLAAVAKTVTAKGGTLATSSSVSGVASTGATSSYDKVNAGASRTFTFTGTVPDGGTAGFTGMKIVSIKWNETDSTSGTTTQTWGLSDFKTTEVYVTAS